MLIGGINTLTLQDYPDKIACILFTVGCNFRCGFCHNPQFVLPEEICNYKDTHCIPEDSFFRFLDQRQGLLDGVVVSGGEPTLHPDLIPFLKKIKAKGFLTKLDTNGTQPNVIAQMLDQYCLDYIAMDIKSDMANYEHITNSTVDLDSIKQTRDLIMRSQIPYEFRTTVISEIHTPQMIQSIGEFCQNAENFGLQNFRNIKVLDPKYKQYTAVSDENLFAYKKILKQYIENVEIRNA